MLTIRQQMEKDLAEANKQYQRPKPSELFDRQPVWMNDLFSRQPDPPRRNQSKLSNDIQREIISFRQNGMSCLEISKQLSINYSDIYDVIQGFNG